MTVPGLQQGLQAGNYTTNGNNTNGTLVFDGLVARIMVRY